MRKRYNEKTFTINEKESINCYTTYNSKGFRHNAVYLNTDTLEMAKTSIQYYNRTWESFEYETILRKILSKIGKSDEEIESKIEEFANEYNDEVKKEFRMIGAIATMAGILANTKEEKNAAKIRILEIGLSQYGIEIPDELKNEKDENKKEAILNKTIEFLKGGDNIINKK